MKNMLLGIMVIVAGVSAIELNVGIISHAGLAHSRLVLDGVRSLL